MSKNSKRNRQTGHINAFKSDIIRAGNEIQHAGRVYYSKIMKWRTGKDAQGNAMPPVPSVTIVRAV